METGLAGTDGRGNMSRVRYLSEFFEHLPVPLYRSGPDGALLAGNVALAQITRIRVDGGPEGP